MTLLNVFSCCKIGQELTSCCSVCTLSGTWRRDTAGALNRGMSYPAMLPHPGTVTLCSARKPRALTSLRDTIFMKVFPERNNFTPRQIMEQFLGR